MRKLCRVYDAGLAGCYILWGHRGVREDYVSRIPVRIGAPAVYASRRGYLVIEGRRGQYDVVSCWPSLEAARERALQLLREVVR